MDKKYPIPDDVDLLMRKYMGAIDIRDMAVKLPFGYRKAIRAAADAIKFKTLFWKRVHAIYPELKGKTISYDIDHGDLTVKDKKAE